MNINEFIMCVYILFKRKKFVKIGAIRGEHLFIK